MTEAEVAEFMCNRQPELIRDRLLADEAFKNKYGLAPPTVLIIGPISINQRELFAAARVALSSNKQQTISAVGGQEIAVVPIDGRVVLKFRQDERQIETAPEVLSVLAPSNASRIAAIDNLIHRFGPTAPDFSALRDAAEQRELSDDEVDQLMTEAVAGVAALQARMEAAAKANRATVKALVPDSLEYYERFCGPQPSGVGQQQYFSTVLPEYRKSLLSRDLVRGLDIALMGALRGDIVPTAWVEQLSDDVLWVSLSACEAQRDPISLLAALDIALGRQHDDRYLHFAEESVTKLCQDEFLRPDGVDVYELMPIFMSLALDRINTQIGGALREPFWKRMCAWMQAGMLIRSTWSMKLDVRALEQWINANRTWPGVYGELVDLRKEPMCRAGNTSRKAFRSEIAGRLALLRGRQELMKKPMPLGDQIDTAMLRLGDGRPPLECLFPGPLEGHIRPAETEGRELSEQDVRQAIERFENKPDGAIWVVLAHLSQYFNFGEQVLASARAAAARVDLDIDGGIAVERLDVLIEGCVVAAAHRDVLLARAIVSRIIASVHLVKMDNELLSILDGLLVAAAAFEEEQSWAAFVEEQLTLLAVRLPAGKLSNLLLRQIYELKQVLPLRFEITAQAETIASAAS